MNKNLIPWTRQDWQSVFTLKLYSHAQIQQGEIIQRDVSCCKCHTPSRPASDTGPNALTHSSGSCGRNPGLPRQATYLVHKYSPTVEGILSLVITHGAHHALPNALPSPLKARAQTVIDSMQNAATWYTAERERRAKCQRN